MKPTKLIEKMDKITPYQQREQMRSLLRELTKKLNYRFLNKEIYGAKSLVITQWDYGDAIAQVKKEFNL